MTKRTPAQKAAVLAVRAAVKQIIADIDRCKTPHSAFHAYFHLDREIVVCDEHNHFRDSDGTMHPIRRTDKIFRSAWTRTRDGECLTQNEGGLDDSK